MVQEKILYTDGRDVTVTDTMFQVKNISYQLIGITKHGIHIVKPHRFPAVAIVLAGMIVLAGTLLNLMPIDFVPAVELMGFTFSGKVIVLCAGAAIVLLGVLIIGLLRERYAVRIATAEGEKDVVVSKHREYITQIETALNRAFNFVRGNRRIES